MECVVLTIFTAGERDYIALLPMEGEDSEEGEVYLYRYSETEDGTPDRLTSRQKHLLRSRTHHRPRCCPEQEYDELVGEDEVE